YLLQKPSGWYFRYVLPHRLRAAVRRREFRFALHTRHRREAKRRATLAFASVQRLLAYLEQHGMPLTPDQIQRLVAEHVRRCVAEIEDAHFSRKRPVDPDESEERLESLDEFDVMLREQIGTA